MAYKCFLNIQSKNVFDLAYSVLTSIQFCTFIGRTIQKEKCSFTDSAKCSFSYDFVCSLSCYLRAVRIPAVDLMKQAMTSNKNDLKPQILLRVCIYSYLVNTFICVLGELKSLVVPMTQCYKPHYVWKTQ